MRVNVLDDTPLIGESFTLECNVMVAKGITSNVHIMWTINDTVQRRANKTVEYLTSEYVLHIDVYDIPSLQMSDNNTVYSCKAVVGAHTEHVEGNDSVTLMIGKYVYILK